MTDKIAAVLVGMLGGMARGRFRSVPCHLASFRGAMAPRWLVMVGFLKKKKAHAHAVYLRTQVLRLRLLCGLEGDESWT
jgi:hypothetical protein